MKPWMFEATVPDGTKLHGAGLQYSEGWWKVSWGTTGPSGAAAGAACFQGWVAGGVGGNLLRWWLRSFRQACIM